MEFQNDNAKTYSPIFSRALTIIGVLQKNL